MRQHYYEANKKHDMQGDYVPFLVSDLMLCVYLVATIIYCVWSA
jgi:hypothetical protein